MSVAQEASRLFDNTFATRAFPYENWGKIADHIPKHSHNLNFLSIYD